MISKNKFIKYFGFGTNKDLAMMQHIVGRDDLKGKAGKLIGYKVCIQKARDMREEIPETSPWKVPPKQIIVDAWGEDFDMFVSIPDPNGVAYGTIWDLTAQDIELVKEWECVEYGLQEEVNAIATDSQGNFIQVETQVLTRPSDKSKIHKVIVGSDYEPYVVDKEKMLKAADKTRTDYLKRKNENNN